MILTQAQQKRIVEELIQGIREEMEERVERVPATWDGIDLRQLLADVAVEKFTVHMTLARKRAYNRDRLLLNL